MSYKQSFAAFAAALALTATAAAGMALAQQARSLPTIAALQPAAPKLGAAIMSALINTNGSIYYGAGVVESAYDSTTQKYTVAFNRPVTGCTISATPWYAGLMATGQVDLAGGNTATVELRSHDDVPRVGPFHVTVFCLNSQRGS